MKKFGLIVTALVLALGALGVGYAAWTDTMTVTGVVNTGSVGFNIIGVSSTFVYKTENHGCEVIYTEGSEPPSPPPGTLIASAITTNNTIPGTETTPEGPKMVSMVWDNIFPDIDFNCDINLRYTGSIPGRMHCDFVGVGTEDAWLIPFLEYDVWVNGVLISDSALEGYQLHQGDFIHAVISIDLDEIPALMNRHAEATAILTVIQWNEYPPVP